MVACTYHTCTVFTFLCNFLQTAILCFQAAAVKAIATVVLAAATVAVATVAAAVQATAVWVIPAAAAAA